jgi:hypothetical protein
MVDSLNQEGSETMNRWIAMLGICVLLALPCLAHPTDFDSAPEVVVPEKILDAREILDQFYRGELKEVYARFSDGFMKEMSQENLTAVRKDISDKLGLEIMVLTEKMEQIDAYDVYVRRARFEKFDQVIEVRINFLSDNSIGALVFAQERK